MENEISRLNHEMTIMQTEFKLVDKTRVKALQVCGINRYLGGILILSNHRLNYKH